MSIVRECHSRLLGGPMLTVLLSAPEAATDAELREHRAEICRLTADQHWAWRWHPGIRTWRLEHGHR
ncbi:MAG: hypothetical protein KGL39_43360 [Patescibacteria group bacterium]|nr:hypothetical protein [Patescibacteria group bacterium]